MTVSAYDIAVGKCYVTTGYLTGYSEVRRVTEVSAFEVKYQAFRDEVWQPWAAVSREKFAAEVDREVGCPD